MYHSHFLSSWLKRSLTTSEQFLKRLISEAVKRVTAVYLRTRSAIIRFCIASQAIWIRTWRTIFSNHAFWWLSGIYFALTIGGVTIYSLWFRSALVTDPVTFFTTAGTISAGGLAIVFSLSTLLIQNASQQTSAGLYRIMTSDWTQPAGYWFIAIASLALFAGAFLSSSFPIVTRWSEVIVMYLMSAVFWVLFTMLVHARKQISPFAGIGKMKNGLLKQINYFDKKLEVLATYVKAHPSFDQTTPDNMVRAGIVARLEQQRELINTWFSHLFDYHGKLLTNNETGAAQSVLSVIHGGLNRYLEMMKDASVTYPEGLFARASNSQSFLDYSLSKLAGVARQSMLHRDERAIRQVVQVIQDLALQSIEINYEPVSPRENPVFEQYRLYLDQITKEAVNLKSMEGMHYLVRAHGVLATAAIKHNIPFQLDATYRSLSSIGIQCLKLDGYSTIWGGVLEVYGSLVNVMVEKGGHYLHIELKSLLENITQLLELSSFAMRVTRFNDHMDYALKVNVIFSSFRKAVSLAADREHQEKPGDRKWSGNLIDLLEELYSPLRQLAEKINLTDQTLTRETSQFSADISCLASDLSVEDKWSAEHPALLREAHSYLHIPTWLIPKKDKIKKDEGVDEVSEAVAKAGLCAIKQGHDEVAEQAVSALDHVVTAVLDREAGPAYGFTEPRVMVKACFIGIIALKQGKRKLVADLKEKIIEFDKRYQQKWFPTAQHRQVTNPRPEQLFWEVTELKEKLGPARSSQRMMLDRAEDRALSEISAEDIDRFTTEIWGQVGERRSTPIL